MKKLAIARIRLETRLVIKARQGQRLAESCEMLVQLSVRDVPGTAMGAVLDVLTIDDVATALTTITDATSTLSVPAGVRTLMQILISSKMRWCVWLIPAEVNSL